MFERSHRLGSDCGGGGAGGGGAAGNSMGPKAAAEAEAKVAAEAAEVSAAFVAELGARFAAAGDDWAGAEAQLLSLGPNHAGANVLWDRSDATGLRCTFGSQADPNAGQPAATAIEAWKNGLYACLLSQGLGSAMDRIGPYRGPREPIAPPR